MKIPPHVADGVFEKELARGAILVTEMRFRQGESKWKYIIILNQRPTESPTLLFLTTSQIDFYDRYPSVDHIRIEANRLPCFRRTTVIDCREVVSIARSELKKKFQEGVLKFSGHLPSGVMEQIDQIVARSRLISLRHKKAILGWQ